MDMINRRTRARWASNDIVLRKGAIGLVIETGAYKIGDGVTPWSDLVFAPGGPFPTPPETTDPLVNYVPFASLALFAAANPSLMAKDSITRNAAGAATSYSVTWPDGARGTYTGTPSTAKPEIIESYKISHILNGVSKTYTQPKMTFDANGVLTNRPSITVSDAGVVISDIGTPTLVFKSRGANSAVLTLGSVTGALLYEIQTKASTGVVWGGSATVSPGDLTQSGLTPGGSYDFRARAANTDGPGSWSAVVTVTIAVPITGLALTAVGGDGKVTLEGSATGAATLELQRGVTATGAWTKIAESTNGSISFVDNGRTNTTQYFYRLIATSPDTSETSAVKAATPIGSVVPMTLLRSRNVIGALSGTYPILRYREPNRKKVCIRNLSPLGDPSVAGSGAKSIQINYSTQRNDQGTQPTDASTWITVLPGQEFIDTSGNVNKIYARPAPTNANTGTQLVEVYTEVTA